MVVHTTRTVVDKLQIQLRMDHVVMAIGRPDTIDVQKKIREGRQVGVFGGLKKEQRDAILSGD